MIGKALYLSRDGNTTGPFEWVELQKLHNKGTLNEFEWFWDADHEQWKPIEELAESLEKAYGSSNTNKSPSSKPPQVFGNTPTPFRSPSMQMSPPLSVVCYSGDKTYGGKVTLLDLKQIRVSAEPELGRPPFAINEKIKIHLLSEKSEATMISNVIVTGSHLENNEWILDLLWQTSPPNEIIEDWKT